MRRWEWLADEVRRRGWTRGAELGVKRGETLFYLLNKAPGLHMTGVDLWAPQPEEGAWGYTDWNHEAHFREVDEKARRFPGRVRIMRMSTLLAAQRTPDRSLDFVFIDANHAQHAVEADIRAWRSKLRDGGALCGHDWPAPSVRAALDQLCPDARNAPGTRCWIDG